MEKLLPEKLLGLTPYDPVEQRFRIHLDANESFVPLPEEILHEICNSIKKFEFNRYPDPMAKGACGAFAELFGINSDYITAGNGSDELISMLLGAFLQKGDKIMTFSPDFTMYSFYSGLFELENSVYIKDEDFNVDINEVIKRLNTENIKLVIFSNPCNPTAVGIERNDIIKLLDNTQVITVIDEAYMDFWNQSVLDLIEEYENLIILKTCSKAFGLASLRCGFAISGKKMTDHIRNAKSPYNVNGLTQIIVKAILSKKEFIANAVNEVKESANMLYSGLKEIENDYNDKVIIYPSKTNFVTLKTDYAEDIFKYLLSKSICIRKLNDKILRITAGRKQENIELLKNIRGYFGKII